MPALVNEHFIYVFLYHCVNVLVTFALYAKAVTGYIDIACYGTPHIRGERNEDILFRLVTPYAIHEVPFQYLA